MTEHLLLAWSILANAMAYGGCIGRNKSDCKIWSVLAISGQVLGGIGLFLILIYLSV